MRVKACVTCSVLYRLWVTVLASPLVSAGFAGSMWVSLPRLVHNVYGAGVSLIGAMPTAGPARSTIARFTIGHAHKLPRGIVAYIAAIALCIRDIREL